MEEDRKVPIVLRKLFLCTGRVLIDVANGDLTMRVHDKNVTFNIFRAIKERPNVDNCL